MASDAAQFITNAAPFLQTSLGSLKMQKAVLAALKGYAAAGVIGNSVINNGVKSSKLVLPPRLSEDRRMAAKINTWLSALNANLGTGLASDAKTMISMAHYLAQYDDETIDSYGIYGESVTLFSHLA